MNKINFALLSALVFATTLPAQAAFNGPTNAQAVSVEEVKSLPDETQVSVKGYIINSLGDEKYTFKDEKGEVVIEVEDENWNGIDVTPQTQIEIIGEVDKELMKPVEIEVEKVNLIK